MVNHETYLLRSLSLLRDAIHPWACRVAGGEVNIHSVAWVEHLVLFRDVSTTRAPVFKQIDMMTLHEWVDITCTFT